MPNHLGDESPRVMNVNEVIDEDAKVLFLGNQGLLKRGLQSSLKSSRMSERSVGEKKESFFTKG
jgi:hypothetical protein